MLNAELNQKDHFNSRYIGKKLAGFGLRSSQILSRKSDYHKKSAIKFDAHRLKIIFKNYGLPVPADFSLDQLDQNDKLNIDNDLSWSNGNLSESDNQIDLDQLNPNKYNNNGEWSKRSKENSGIGVIPQTNGNNQTTSDREAFEI